jgi:hypothetical protein
MLATRLRVSGLALAKPRLLVFPAMVASFTLVVLPTLLHISCLGCEKADKKVGIFVQFIEP